MNTPGQRGTRSSVDVSVDGTLQRVEQGIETLHGFVGAFLEEPAVASEGERDVVVAGPLQHLKDVAFGADGYGDVAVPQPEG